ncbi:hypothetical protein BV898_03853 [Hypsibius exemplaris]|uniref:Uncharacterized protein n=1 Tax=Hypsibius exemplaris TaxID=2072580 RepID=A0A1W0X4D9_HYPEX|nr:hypothetical protein BV898_03853 [Hypsibius exemplaris]
MLQPQRQLCGFFLADEVSVVRQKRGATFAKVAHQRVAYRGRQTRLKSFPPVQRPPVWEALRILRGPGPHILSQLTLPVVLPFFDCASVKQPGFYADVSLDCRVFHRCDIHGSHTAYLAGGSPSVVFNQITLTPDWYYNVNCSRSPEFFDYSNPRLYNNSEWLLFDDGGDFEIEASQSAGLQVNTPVYIAGDLVIDTLANGTNITGYFASIDKITLNIVKGGSYPINCAAGISLINVTATDPDDLTVNDNIPANVLARLGADETIRRPNDPVASTSKLRYIAVDPATGRVIVDAQVLNGTEPADTPAAFALCSTKGTMNQTYDVVCTDAGGRQSNHVQFTVMYAVCPLRLKIACEVTTCGGKAPALGLPV